MKNKRHRSIFYVCSCISGSDLITDQIIATTLKEAEDFFYKKYNNKSKNTLGPFYKKKIKVKRVDKVMSFMNKASVKAIFNEWVVDAFYLQEPKDSALLIFKKRLDDKNVPFPKGNVVVLVNDLRELNE